MSAEEKKQRFKKQFFTFVAVIGGFTAILLIPFVFNRYLAVTPLLEVERRQLTVFCSLVCATSCLLFIFKSKLNMRWALLFFGCLAIINIELAARLAVHYTVSFEKRDALGKAANRTYLEYTAYKGHPFLSFTGRPSLELVGNKSLGNLASFNNFGFTGPNFNIEKPENTTRVISMGGSTTISGYPAYTERFLNSSNASSSFEVYNFGMTYWTSAHTTVNFVLNVLDFEPDYVVFHHAWNEDKVRNFAPEKFRNDYSHALTYFHEPEITDKYPFRISMLYRALKMKLGIIPEWASLGTATTLKNDSIVQPLYSNLKELRPFRRNIETILDLALIRGIKPVLTTQPHSTDPNIPFYYAYKTIDQGNAIIRDIAKNYNDRVLFLDIDSIMTGHHNTVFIDLGHMNEKGIQFKGELIGKCILSDMSNSESMDVKTLQKE